MVLSEGPVCEHRPLLFYRREKKSFITKIAKDPKGLREQ